jgi:outer membrane receptor for ferrienterochelin and colicin
MKFLNFMLIICPLSVYAQTGQLVGKILDANTGQAIVDAGIQVVGTTVGTTSGLEGRYRLTVNSGTVTLQIRRIGYTPKTITGIMVTTNATVIQDVALTAANFQLATVSVTAEKEKGTISEALNQQRNATNVVSAITAEQISRSPDGDAAQAAQRISGVTVQDGKYLQVRGLSERYTTAALNGVRIPSPEPERKVVPLDLFPTSLLQDISTSKTFSPDQPGDFAGANVNIRTKEFPANKEVNYSMSFGGNSVVLNQNLPMAPQVGGELFGLVGSSRNMPSALQQANFFGTVTQQQMQDIVTQQRNVWSPLYRTGMGNGSVGMSTGGNSILGKRIGYVVSANYGYSEERKANEVTAVGNQGPNNTVVPLTTLRGTTGRVGVQWGGIANISTLLGQNSRLALNTTFTRNADNEARVDSGFDENLSDSIARTTLRYVARGVVNVTALGEHQLSTSQKTAWSLTYGNTVRKEPDRSDMVYSQDKSTGVYRILPSLDGARRVYFNLLETNIVGQWDHTITIHQSNIKVGMYGRSTNRTAEAPIYAFITRAGDNITSQPANIIFNQSNSSDVNVQPIGQAGSYTASDITQATYVMTEMQMTNKIRVIAGGRVEVATIKINTKTQGGFEIGSELGNIDVLPSLLINTKLTDAQTLRFAVSRTLSRPEYRELSPVTFRDVLGGVSVTGNSKLQRALINNVDVRYEWFPTNYEVFSVSLFTKEFMNPIERVEQATSGAYQATFQNAITAFNYGVELEARKQLLTHLTTFSNITLMKSSVELDTMQALTVTDVRRPLVGQAPYVVNAGITYSSLDGRTNATLLFNRVGSRIFAAGVIPLPNIVEKSRNLLDITLKFPFLFHSMARVDMRNILDARYSYTQGNMEREGFNVGRTLSLGVSIKQ